MAIHASARKRLVAGSAALITFLIYLPVLHNAFINWDDGEYVYENPFIRRFDLDFIRWALFRFYAANWHPLTWVSHALDYALWGLNPSGHHLTSIVVHAINTALVVLVSIKLVAVFEASAARRGTITVFKDEKTRLAAGAVAGLLFGLHPLHVESVAWIAERKDILCGFFFLLSILSYLGYAAEQDDRPGRNRSERRRNRRYLFSLGFFALALLSKPMAVTLPLVLILIDWYPAGRFRSAGARKGILLEKLPFFLLSLFSSAITILAQSSKTAIAPVGFLPLPLRIISGVGAVASYLMKMIVPAGLSPFYPFPPQQDITLLSAKYLAPWLIAAAITAASVAVARKQKLWLVAWVYFLITLFPVLGFLQVGNQSMADRFTYLPSLGPFLAAGVGTGWCFEKINRFGKRIVIMAGAGLVVLVYFVFLSYLTVHQIGVWKNSIVFWSTVISETGKRPPFVAYLNRGSAFQKIGRADLAIEDLNTAIAINPNYYEAYYDRGLAFAAQGSLDRAVKDFDEALALNPAFDPAYNNRGAAHLLSGRRDLALEDFATAIELNSTNAEAYVNRAYCYLNDGKTALALPDLQKGCSLGNAAGCKTLSDILRNNQDRR